MNGHTRHETGLLSAPPPRWSFDQHAGEVPSYKLVDRRIANSNPQTEHVLSAGPAPNQRRSPAGAKTQLCRGLHSRPFACRVASVTNTVFKCGNPRHVTKLTRKSCCARRCRLAVHALQVRK